MAYVFHRCQEPSVLVKRRENRTKEEEEKKDADDFTISMCSESSCETDLEHLSSVLKIGHHAGCEARTIYYGPRVVVLSALEGAHFSGEDAAQFSALWCFSRWPRWQQ